MQTTTLFSDLSGCKPLPLLYDHYLNVEMWMKTTDFLILIEVDENHFLEWMPTTYFRR